MEPSIDPAQLLEHAGWMKHLARSLVGEDQAEDVVQQTWMTMLKSPPPRPATTVAWLATVVRRLAYRTHRGERRRRERERSVQRQEMTTASTDSSLQRAELQRLLMNAVLELDESYRSTVILRYFEELSVKGVAEKQGVSVDTVKTRLRRALAKLREKLDRAHGGERRAWIALLGPLACGVEASTAKSSVARHVSTSAEATRASNVTRSIIAGGVAVSVKKVTVIAVVGALMTAGLGGVLLWIPPEPDSEESRVTSIESSRELVVAESEDLNVDITPANGEASEGEIPQPAEKIDTGSIRGRVRDRQNAAVANVRVRAFRVTKPDGPVEETELEGDTETTELGEFELTDLPVGTYIVRAVSGEHRPSEVRALDLSVGDLLEVDIEVQRGLAIAGVVPRAPWP